MPAFKIFIEKIYVNPKNEIGTVSGKTENEALDNANFELGLHWERYINPENTSVQLKLRKVV